MIIKTRSITKEHAYNALDYVVKDEKNHIVLSSDGADFSSSRSFVNDCKLHERPNVKKSFISTVISPHVDDKLSLAEFNNLLLTVQKELGLDNRQYFAVLHQNTSTPHIHLISNRINYNDETWNDHHVAWKCQEACKKIAQKLKLTSAFDRKGTYVKTDISEISKYQTETHTNLKFIQNCFKEIKYQASNIDEIFDFLEKKGIDVKVSKFKNGLYGVSMKYKDSTFKASKIDRLLTLLPENDSYKPNLKMQKILDNNYARKTGARTEAVIVKELQVSKSNPELHNEIYNESVAFINSQISKYPAFNNETKKENEDELYKRRKRRIKDRNI